MTNVAVWYLPSTKEIWGVADALLSGELALTDYAAKILPLVARAYRRSEEIGIKWAVEKEVAFGFAYAGKALTALLTHAALSAFVGNLESNSLPSLRKIATLTAYISERYVKEIGQRDARPTAEYVIFGKCPELQRFIAYKIEAVVERERAFEHRVVEVDLVKDGAVILGYDPGGLKARISELQKLDAALGIRDVEPRIAIEERIRSDRPSSVGGTLQCGIVGEGGFRTFASLFHSANSRRGPMQYLGFDLSEEIVPRIGCSLALVGLL